MDVKRFDVIRIPPLEGSSCITDVFFRVSANIIFDFGFSSITLVVRHWLSSGQHSLFLQLRFLSAVDFLFFSRRRRLWLEILLFNILHARVAHFNGISLKIDI